MENKMKALLDSIEKLFSSRILPRRSNFAVCLPSMEGDGYSPDSEWCKKCCCSVKPQCEAYQALLSAMSELPRKCDMGNDAKELLEEYISMRGFTSDNQIRALYELALPVIEWLLEPTEKQKGENK